jgi:XTP/dITP diphosphohydrolase
LRESKIWLATGNSHKLMEARDVLAEYGIRLEHMPVERVEIQADDPAEIATHSLRQIPDEGRSVAVEDAGLFIDHYGGFPGPYSSYILETLDLPGILKLMEGLENREASYHSFVALRHEGRIRLFRGTVKGRIAHSIRGTHGFGYDPIFVPDEGDGRTFGETSNEEKNAISHRARAFRSLGAWLLGSEEDF